MLPDGQPKFIVFRRDVATNIPDRAEVRIVAKVGREFSAEAAVQEAGRERCGMGNPKLLIPVPSGSGAPRIPRCMNSTARTPAFS